MPRKQRIDSERMAELQQAFHKAQRALRAAKAEEKKQARSDDTRGKIIIGAFMQEHAIRNPGSEVQQVVLRGVKEHIALRPRDAYLFAGLLAKWETPSPAPPDTKDDRSGEGGPAGDVSTEALAVADASPAPRHKRAAAKTAGETRAGG